MLSPAFEICCEIGVKLTIAVGFVELLRFESCLFALFPADFGFAALGAGFAAELDTFEDLLAVVLVDAIDFRAEEGPEAARMEAAWLKSEGQSQEKHGNSATSKLKQPTWSKMW